MAACVPSEGADEDDGPVRCPPSNPNCEDDPGDVGRGDGGRFDDGGVGDDTGTPPRGDEDGDGIPDGVEGSGDTDGDGIPDFQDPDTDGDEVPDSVEGAGDTDGDGTPDFRDFDSDGDGISDFVEGYEDTDGDGEPNFRDGDADGDGIPDNAEGTGDSDGDGAMDFVDDDADNDGVKDRYEGLEDEDGDGIPNFLDLDSDGDGWGDRDEYGRGAGETELPPIDHDSDGIDDFLDLDSDGDGLADRNELGCPTSTSRTEWDSDGDSYSDLLEVAFGSAPCDPTSDITEYVDFFFELPFLGDELHDTLEFSTDVRQGDIVFSADTTGSMSGENNTLRNTLSSTIIPSLASRLPDAAYGVSHFDDMPCDGFGSGSDRPFALLQRVTRDIAAAQAGVNSLPGHSGGDTEESGLESLFQIATGVGRTVGDNSCTNIPAFNPATGLVPGVADGEIGGVGFRNGSVPIVVHITDAPSQARGEGGYPYGASRAEAYGALAEIGAKVVGVASGANARSDLEQIARETGSLVPTCAWDESRPGGCGVTQCCTGQNGAGQAPDGMGMCPMVFDINGSGNGLDQSIVTGITAVINFSVFDLTTALRRDEEEFATSGIDTTCFIKSIEAISAIARPGACSTEPVLHDADGDGIMDTFQNVTPGTQLFFDIGAFNDCVEPTESPQVFVTYIDVIGAGAAVLDTQVVTILVPPDIKR